MDTKAIQQHFLEQLIETNEAIKAQKLAEKAQKLAEKKAQKLAEKKAQKLAEKKAQKLLKTKQKRNERLVVRYLKDKLPYISEDISEEKVEQMPEEEKSRLLPFAKRKQIARVIGKFAKTFGSTPVATAVWWSFALVVESQPTLLSFGLLGAGMISTVTAVIFFALNIGNFLREIKFYSTGNHE